MKKYFKSFSTVIPLLLAFFSITTSVHAQVSEIPLEKKVAQMIILGFKGTELSDSSEIVCTVREQGVGGIILFEHNIAQPEDVVDSRESLRHMCGVLQRAATERLIISIDQEGGNVNRMKTKYGFPKSVTAQYLGEVNQEDTSRYYYHKTAEQLKALGINVNFAPCVDLNINAQSPAIGLKGRSYSISAKKVTRHARFCIEEHHQFGVKTALKHFPGHGSSLADSHLGFTDITNTWSHKELEPYSYFIHKSLCDIVMVSHTFNSKIDSIYPATLSQRTIDSLLRKKMGYDGIVITDDMNMKAISANYTFEQAVTLTINAGVDMIIVSNNIKGVNGDSAKEIIDTIVSLVMRGEIPVSRIDESYNRIIRFKQTLNK